MEYKFKAFRSQPKKYVLPYNSCYEPTYKKVSLWKFTYLKKIENRGSRLILINGVISCEVHGMSCTSCLSAKNNVITNGIFYDSKKGEWIAGDWWSC